MFTTSRSTFDAAPGLGATAKHRSPFPTPHSPFPIARHGFTLIELLIVISILAILSSMVLFALAGAEGTAKEMRTQATITKLHNLVMQKYESYRTRRAPITIPANVQTRPAAFAQHRLNAIRELMRMEMPDRFTDIIDDPVTLVTPLVYGGGPPISRPSASRAYQRALLATANDQFQGAECLYLIITRGIDDPDVMEQFAPSEIGDADEDGMKEFLDAWGRPINFLRWAPGFESSMQPKNQSAPVYTEHDPFDPRKIHKPPSNGDAAHWPEFFSSGVHPPLYPLIFSAGADGVYDMATDSQGTPFRYSRTTAPPNGDYSNTSSPPNNPYFPIPQGNNDKFLLGSIFDVDNDGDNRIDNITNHDSASQ